MARIRKDRGRREKISIRFYTITFVSTNIQKKKKAILALSVFTVSECYIDGLRQAW